ncbi:MAG: endonuclease/exonuclease/phosphatase family protein [Deltaproteobacteria bacterium]|nr:endonuclease/exonuclease/phosphatase family protein [Deltaproteobacteria bacterium]
MPTLALASWNVLADSYVQPRFFPHTPPALLEPVARRARVVQRAREFDVDVLCLQEVEPVMLAALRASFQPGHRALYVGKTGKPDGCAILVRDTIAVKHEQTLRFVDGDGSRPDTGHVALLLVLEHEGATFGVATTHLKWHPAETPPAEHTGLRQVTQLLAAVDGLRAGCAAWILCGDLNAPAGSNVVDAVDAAGFVDVYRDRPRAFTANANNKAKRIDYLFHSADLQARAGDVAVIDDVTPLPSDDQPSDHLPIRGWFTR